MSEAELNRAIRSFCARRPFKPFLIEFVSGEREVALHPEAVRRSGNLFHFQGAQQMHSLFSSTSVCRPLDAPPRPS